LFGLAVDFFAQVTRDSPGIGPLIHYTDLPASKQHRYLYETLIYQLLCNKLKLASNVGG